MDEEQTKSTNEQMNGNKMLIDYLQSNAIQSTADVALLAETTDLNLRILVESGLSFATIEELPGYKEYQDRKLSQRILEIEGETLIKPMPNLDIIKKLEAFMNKGEADKSKHCRFILTRGSQNNVSFLKDIPRPGFILVLGIYNISRQDAINQRFDIRDGELFVLGTGNQKELPLIKKVRINGGITNPILIKTGFIRDVHNLKAEKFDLLYKADVKNASSAVAKIVTDPNKPIDKINLDPVKKVKVGVFMVLSLAGVVSESNIQPKDLAILD